ncbi:MAG: YidC/Oxa1 family membrane protein insertase [Phascolarctobacterium sp.]|nr:YidC/Oxa1 family membrane protein insertase [Phascolarctobacterium sp.]
MLYNYTIYPIECVYKIIYLFLYHHIYSYGLSLVLLSIFTYCVTHPLLQWASGMSREEKEVQEYMKPQLDKIKAELKGAEQHRAIQRLFKRYGYHPVMAVRSAVGVMLQLPFLMAAYYMLSNLEEIRGVAWLCFKDLGQPDVLLGVVNIMPFVMTAVNLLSAFTTPGFSRRERIQAFVIAGLFLVLLYNAPCALLIYWTFNNVWTLAGNLLGKLKLLPKNLLVQYAKKNKINAYFYVAGAIALTIGLLLPLDIYMNNSGDFWFKGDMVFKYFLLSTCILFVAALVVGAIVILLKIDCYVTSVLLGILVAICLQAYVINLNYGVLDGTPIAWDKFGYKGHLNTLIWLVCICFPLVLSKYVGMTKLCSCCKYISVFIIGVQIFGLCYTADKVGIFQKSKQENYVVTTKNLFSFSQERNVIVLLLDTFDAGYMDQLLASADGDNYRRILQGFTYYPDALGSYSFTKSAVPAILTGKINHNERAYRDYIEDAYRDNPTYTFLKDNDYSIDVYTEDRFVATQAVTFSNVINSEYQFNGRRPLFYNYYKLVSFRFFPHIFKRYAHISTEVFNKYRKLSVMEKPFDYDVQNYYNMLNMTKLQNSPRKTFKFIHLLGTHVPYTFDKTLKTMPGREYTAIEEAAGCMTLVDVFLKKLKEGNVYDNSVIIIMADHGYLNIRHNPMFMIKNPKEAHEFKVSDVPITYNDTGKLLASACQGKNIDEAFFKGLYTGRRTYLLYWWLNSGDDYLPPMMEYELTGNAQNHENLKLTGRTFTNEEYPSYELGKKLNFSNYKETSLYCISNFYEVHNVGVGILGDYAKMRFALGNVNQDLKLNLQYTKGYGKKHQLTVVRVNGTIVGHFYLNDDGISEVTIPKELAGKSKIEVQFDFPANNDINSTNKTLFTGYNGRIADLKFIKMVIDKK